MKLLHSYTCLPARQVARLLRKKQYNYLTIYQSKPAFTLIELMIVIALIGILSSFGVYGYQSSQKKARDGQRKSDLQQVKKALEAARNDCQGGSYYPFFAYEPTTTQYANRYNDLQTLLTSSNLAYLDSPTVDPKNVAPSKYAESTVASTPNVCPDNSGSMTVSGTKTFALFARLEIKNDPDSATSVNKCFIANEWTSNSAYVQSNGAGYGYYVCND